MSSSKSAASTSAPRINFATTAIPAELLDLLAQKHPTVPPDELVATALAAYAGRELDTRRTQDQEEGPPARVQLLTASQLIKMLCPKVLREMKEGYQVTKYRKDDGVYYSWEYGSRAMIIGRDWCRERSIDYINIGGLYLWGPLTEEKCKELDDKFRNRGMKNIDELVKWPSSLNPQCCDGGHSWKIDVSAAQMTSAEREALARLVQRSCRHGGGDLVATCLPPVPGARTRPRDLRLQLLPLQVDSSWLAADVEVEEVERGEAPSVVGERLEDMVRCRAKLDLRFEEHIRLAAEVSKCPGKKSREWVVEDTVTITPAALYNLAKRFGLDCHIQPLPPDPEPLNPDRIPGWTGPSGNGLYLYDHQKSAVRFLLGRRGCGLVGDEMGVGKTATAIAAAVALRARKILVVGPAIARSVWADEIPRWTNGAGAPISLESSENIPALPHVGWVLATYDLLIDRPKLCSLSTDSDREILLKSLKDGAKLVDDKARSVRIHPQAHEALAYLIGSETSGLSKEARAKLREIYSKLLSPVRRRLEEWKPDAIIIDEAHRIKNQKSKRTAAVLKMVPIVPHRILLTGTPLRNHQGDIDMLADAVAPGLRAEIAGGTTTQEAARSILDVMMIRRTKLEVLPSLPTIRRQTIKVPLAPGDEKIVEYIHEYYHSMDFANVSYASEMADSGNRSKARQAAMAGWSMARRALGCAKVRTGLAEELLSDVHEATGSVLVFGHHEEVRRHLVGIIGGLQVPCGHIHGGVGVGKRAEIAKKFQESKIGGLVASTHAAGEALTLTRASSVVFAELDWVPAVMQQAEARIHRPSQVADSIHVIHLIADLSRFGRGDSDSNIDLMMHDALMSKLQVINTVLGENQEVLATEAENEVIAELVKRAQLRYETYYSQDPERIKHDLKRHETRRGTRQAKLKSAFHSMRSTDG